MRVAGEKRGEDKDQLVTVRGVEGRTEWKEELLEVLREIGRELRGVEKEMRKLREEGVVEESEGDRLRREDVEKRMEKEKKAAGRGRTKREEVRGRQRRKGQSGRKID